MSEKMLIDASHPEETRVVVVRGNRIEEFDFESQHKKQLRGNIYLAKVTRVEPSLQAAFVDYGGNRHGFLAFSEIHPDYYQIPLADRQALLEAEAQDAAAEADADDEEAEKKPAKKSARRSRKSDKSDHSDKSEAAEDGETSEDGETTEKPTRSKRAARKSAGANDDKDAGDESEGRPRRARRSRKKKDAEDSPQTDAAASGADNDAGKDDAGQNDAGKNDAGDDDAGKNDGGPDVIAAAIDADEISEPVESMTGRGDASSDTENGDDDTDDDNGTDKVDAVGSEDALEELPERARRKPRKQYRIQEVIKRRQILLVQVVKEERGNKGAALTTYLSLAGRYSVLMPNTARGGGISRKITNVTDRKRLKEIARELDVPQGMGVILRTAGASRTRVEIKRDFEYLMRLWENVRNLTLRSTAPCLVYEEGSLIKRSIRDLYTKDIREVVVSGEDGYREAKDFMKMLMPSHAKVVQPYRDLMPIFARSGIDAQLDRMVQPQVTLKSGGYIIINQTEALVAIDVNSGRSTREHSIEDTALQTNLEAAEEVARQLRLRDLAGLIVIDFIDMDENRNNRAVEKKVKDCLKHDRARIQVGRISHFGLLEMSRQRIRASVLESTMQVCAHCAGTGHVRSASSVALHVLRGIEEYLLKHTTHHITVRTSGDTALYMLNNKRDTIFDLEKRFGLRIAFASDPDVGSQYFAIDRGEAVDEPVTLEHIHANSPSYDEADDGDAEIDTVEEDNEGADNAPETSRDPASAVNGQDEDGDQDDNRSRKRRRRRRRGRRGGGSGDGAGDGNGAQDGNGAEQEAGQASGDTAEEGSGESSNGDDDEGRSRKRRRGRRGGRKNRDDASVAAADDDSSDAQANEGDAEASAADAAASNEDPASAAAAADAGSGPDTTSEAVSEEAPAKPKRPRRRRKSDDETSAAPSDEAPTNEAQNAGDDADKLDLAAAATAPVVEEPADNDGKKAAPRDSLKGEVAAETAEATDAAAPAQGEDSGRADSADEATGDDNGKRDRRAQTDLAAIASAPVVTSSKAAEEDKTDDDAETGKSKPKKGGWWQRRGFL
ncbi:Rne/Rng family ribonuclease [Pseudohoeflea coraliihabitans]|uniref:Ribonuclease E n=1 Tax=Pseudohoeflea coraliihabitans TaxID=2860393 RepID=A0ABS6WSK3_9HYPH|nr:ribonuclease E/G [Pseudohoeflea sp. DP4N28-3]MBW3098942.1 Rne/Rng family ribonuclease [Pseudohoeflea sp. DP4N28-3]